MKSVIVFMNVVIVIDGVCHRMSLLRSEEVAKLDEALEQERQRRAAVEAEVGD